jgi:hypothetical protein
VGPRASPNVLEEDKNLLSFAGIQPRLPSHPCGSLLTVLTELSRVPLFIFILAKALFFFLEDEQIVVLVPAIEIWPSYPFL